MGTDPAIRKIPERAREDVNGHSEERQKAREGCESAGECTRGDSEMRYDPRR